MVRNWQSGTNSRVPLLPGTPLLGSLPTFRKNAFAVLKEADALGDVVRINLFHTPIYFVKHPDALPPLFDTQDLWLRGEGLQPMLGRNVLTTNGTEWQSSRELAQPSFHPSMTDLASEDFVQRAMSYLEEWRKFTKSDEPTDLACEVVRLFAKCATPAFGLDLLPEHVEAFPDVVLRLQRWAFANLAGGKGRSRQVRKDMAMLDEIIANSLALPAPDDKPPSYLERIRQDHSIDRDRLRDHMMLVLIASADNPPNAWAYVIWTLADNLRWEEAVRAEIQEVLGDEPPTVEALEKLPLLARVVDEVLRLYPPVWMLARNSQRDAVLMEHSIPAGTLALAGTYFIHRHPEFWEQPEVFDPDRFLPERVATRHRLAYLPFGAGPRRCIGSRLALQQIRLLLVLFLQRFRATRASSDPLPLQGLFALRSLSGIPCRLEEIAPQ